MFFHDTQNIRFVCFLNRFRFRHIPISFGVIAKILGLLPFSGVMFIVLRCSSKSLHSRLNASPILIPVSFSICKSALSRAGDALIKASISCSVGINGSRSSTV